MRHSFPLRVLAITFMVLALPLLLDSFLFFQRSYRSAIRGAKENLRYIANTRSFEIHQVQQLEQEILREVSFIINNSKEKNLQKILSQIADATRALDFFVAIPGEKNQFFILSSNIQESIGKTFEKSEEFSAALLGDERGFFLYDFLDQPKLYNYMARPLRFGSYGKEKGLLIGRGVVGDTIDAILHRNIPSQMQFVLLQSDGIVISATDSTMLGQFFNPLSEKERDRIIGERKLGTIHLSESPITEIAGEHLPFFLFLYKGQLQLAFRVEIPDLQATLIVYLPKIIFFSKVVQEFFLIYLFYGLIFIIGGIAAYWCAIWLARPLTQLSNVMNQVKQGNLTAQFIEQPFGYEINFLGTVFNKTVRSLLDTMQSIENERVQKETYERELTIGRKVQKTLLPPPKKSTDDVDIVGHYSFAKEVGGDFYDYAVYDNNISLCIADASGRGVSSCLYALTARSFVRSAATIFSDLGQVIEKSNNALLEDTGDTGMFVTLLLANYSTKTRVLDYYSSGHVPGIIKKRSGEVVLLEHEGMAMGLMKLHALETHHIVLERGDIVLFYTSGLLDVVNEKGVIFSQRRLVKYIEEHSWQSADKWVEGILDEVSNYQKAAILEEEMTLLVMKVK